MNTLSLIFTGHMIDTPDRIRPRFPAHMEVMAGEAIFDHVRKLKDEYSGDLVGISSGACGGDILFLEACQTLEIESYLFLPFGHETFLKSSVNISISGDWEKRFLSIWGRLDERHREVIEPPDKVCNIYDACNLRMLEFGQNAGEEVCLLAFWDGNVPEKPGGTADFVRRVKERGHLFYQIALDQLEK